MSEWRINKLMLHKIWQVFSQASCRRENQVLFSHRTKSVVDSVADYQDIVTAFSEHIQKITYSKKK